MKLPIRELISDTSSMTDVMNILLDRIHDLETEVDDLSSSVQDLRWELHQIREDE
jgi:uncharacterized protein YoxC